MKIKIISFAIFSTILVSSCTVEFGNNCDEGNGNSEIRELDLSPITRVDLGMPGVLFVQEGPQFIQIEGPSDIIDRIENESRLLNGRWSIELDKCYDGPTIKIWVTLPEFEGLAISGIGDIESLDTLRNVEDIVLAIEGSGNLEVWIQDAQDVIGEIQGTGNLTLKARDVEDQNYSLEGSGNILSKFRNGTTCNISIEGTGNVDLFGIVNESNLSLQGSGNIKAATMCSSICDIRLEGTGNCEVKVEDELTIRLEGSGNVCYKGRPQINQDIEGTGVITDCN